MGWETVLIANASDRDSNINVHDGVGGEGEGGCGGGHGEKGSVHTSLVHLAWIGPCCLDWPAQSECQAGITYLINKILPLLIFA